MKPFDLEAAKAGATVCMRIGENARIICTDRRGAEENSVIALVDTGAYEVACFYNKKGKRVAIMDSDFDLFMRDDDYAEKMARGEYGSPSRGKKMIQLLSKTQQLTGSTGGGCMPGRR